MNYEQTWSMPLPNWQPQGSYLESATPPAAGPVDGTLVQLPCINQDWLPLVLGSLDQLRNPSTWLDTLSDAARESVLAQVDYLRSIIAQSIVVSCVPPVEYRFQDCVLQTSSDAGATWVDVPGWSSGFADCVTSVMIPPVPINPRGDVIQQHACNIAGFLASEIIQKAMVVMEGYIGSTNEQAAFAHSLINAIGFAFPITNAVANAAYGFYQEVVSQLLSEVTTVATDPTFWAEVTCSIYSAIKMVGYLDASSFVVAGTNIHAITYAYSWAPNAVGNYWNELGLLNIQALQNVGAIDDVDCSSCVDAWCYEWDFRTGTADWLIISGLGTHDGSGFHSIYFSGTGQNELGLSAGGFSHSVTITRLRLAVSAVTAHTGAENREIACYLGGTLVDELLLPNGATSGVVVVDLPLSAPLVIDNLKINYPTDGLTDGQSTIVWVQMWGEGACPFPPYCGCAD